MIDCPFGCGVLLEDAAAVQVHLDKFGGDADHAGTDALHAALPVILSCVVCEHSADGCTCPLDEGGERPCLHCGTTGWDCLDGLNRADGQHCCGRCPMIGGHRRPVAEVAR